MSRDIQYIGMDVHKEAIVIAVRNGGGKLVQWRCYANRQAFCSFRFADQPPRIDLFARQARLS